MLTYHNLRESGSLLTFKFYNNMSGFSNIYYHFAFFFFFALILFCTSSFSLQYINRTGFRACVKELFVNQHDPLSVSYAIMPGRIEKKDHFDLYLLECLFC